MQEILSHTITYKGKLADDQIINSQDIAYSTLGAAKISTSIIHYICTGRVPKGNYAKSYQCVSRPPKPGSYEFVQYIIPVAPAFAENPQGFVLGASFLFQTIWCLLMNTLTKGPNHDIVAIIKAINEGNQARDKAWLEALNIVARERKINTQDGIELLDKHFNDTIPEMAKVNKNNAVNFVQPIGNSCDTVINFFQNGGNVTLGTSEAEMIRSRESDSVGEEIQYECIRITELNLSNGRCILNVLGFDENVPGYIHDPVLRQPSNIYSTALDKHKSLRLTAKPILRDSAVIKLHISNARPL